MFTYKNFKYFLIILLACLLLVVYAGNRKTAAVEAFLTKYYIAKHALLIEDITTTDAIQRYTALTTNEGWVKEEINTLLEERATYKKTEVKILTVETKITADYVNVLCWNCLRVRVSEHVAYATDAVDRYSNEPIVSEMLNEYTVKISTENKNHWVVSEEKQRSLFQ